MIKHKIGRTAILNRLNKIEEIQANKTCIKVVYITVLENGKLSCSIEAKTHFFETMFEVENYLTAFPNITNKTTLLLDDIQSVSNDLYLPGEPILYYCNSEKRKEFIAAALIPEKWLQLYILLIQQIFALTIESPNIPLYGFENPALQDLMINKNSMNTEQLVERYKDQKWFNKIK